MDRFDEYHIGACKDKNLGDVRGQWSVTVRHDGSGGWQADTLWIQFYSGVYLKCDLNYFLDNDDDITRICQMQA